VGLACVAILSVTGSGAGIQLTFGGIYKGLRADLIA
jgi:hypothetical protein